MYTSKEEKLSPTVNYRHTRILRISVLLSRINEKLRRLYEWKEDYKKSPENFVGVSFEILHDKVNFTHSGFSLHKLEKDDDINREFMETMQKLNWSMLSSYITFLEIERESLIKEFNRLETAKAPKNYGKEVQDPK